MAMYLVSDEELNRIIRLRRRDVTKLITDLREQYPDASLEDILAATDQYFAQQVVAYDYLADYAAEEIAFNAPEPEAHEEEAEVEVEAEAEVEAEVEDPIVSIDEEPQNVDPLTDPDVDPNAISIVDDTVQVIDDTTPADAELEPAAIELVEPVAPEAEADKELEVADPAVAEEAAREERAARISLRALQRELKQIDRV